jgi:pimeloyl-ACP methyl ester carboxylesterase
MRRALLLLPLLGCAPPVVDFAPAVVDPTCEAEGCLRGLLHVVDVTRAELEAVVAPGIFVENGYAVWVMAYATGGRAATATLTTPIATPTPDGGFPIVVNNHGTVGLDDPCRISGTIAGSALAGLFGARGTIGVAPDHPGLGTPGLQPWLVADVTGRSALDAIRAARAAAAVIDVATDGRAAIVGLSQGGHATLAAAAVHADHAPELDVRGFAAAAPASMFFGHWQQGAAVDGPHLVFHALLAEAWAEVYGGDADDAFAAGFDRAVLRTACTFDPALRPDATVLGDVVPTSAEAVFSSTWRDAFSSGDLDALPWLAQGFAENRLQPFTATAPVAIFQGRADEVVLSSQTRELVETLRAGGTDVELIEIDRGTHIDTAFGFLGSAERATDESVAWVKDVLR